MYCCQARAAAHASVCVQELHREVVLYQIQAGHSQLELLVT